MTRRSCPIHGDQMRELARGLCDDERSLSSEATRAECEECARWWVDEFSGEAYDVIDGAVAKAISSFDPPKRRRYRWLAAVAALVLAVGVGVGSMLWRGPQDHPAHAGDEVSKWDFESGDLDETFPAAVQARKENDASDTTSTIFTNDLESGDLSGWHTSS